MRGPLLLLLAFCACVAPATAQERGIPDLSNSYWTCRAEADVIVVACPAGDGQTLAEAWPVDGGAPVDATIDLWIIDGLDNPIFMYPFEDIWIDAPGLDYCPGGTCATDATDITGHTTIEWLLTGGRAFGDVTVLINGDAIAGSAPNLSIVSPDITGDRAVDVSDLTVLANAVFGSYDAAADFDGDGEVNLTEVVIMARHWGNACP